MSLIVGCAKCSKKFKVGDDKGGKRIKCPGCAAIIQVPASDVIEEVEPASSDQIKPYGQLTCPECEATFVPRLPRPGNPLRCPECRAVHPNSPFEETRAQKRERLADNKRNCPEMQRALGLSGYSDEEEAKMRSANFAAGLAEFVMKTLWILFLFGTLR